MKDQTNADALVVGIDLGTTNSSVAVLIDGRPVLIPIDGSELMPSVVGLAPDGTVLVGRAARNQFHLYPDRTVRSIKRLIGSDQVVELGEQRYTPVEVSAMILRRLKMAASEALGRPVERAVITVPAYFSDAQRTATREAGEVAGLTVERVLSEPTAAALCYPQDDATSRTVLVYDLGGGTFDVSVVRIAGDMTEVLASHGDPALGGDDFDCELEGWLLGQLPDDTGKTLDLRARARLARAAEDAKIALSTESFVTVTEEHLTGGGAACHLDCEVARATFEGLIEALLERTRDSVQVALTEAGVLVRDLDDVLLVGGASRTPRVGHMLSAMLGLTPRQDVDPDRAVALGAALHGGRLAGHEGRILIDVTPFTFGTSYLGNLAGVSSIHCYQPIIRRNTPIPVRCTETFYTMVPGQAAIEVMVYQGEEADARLNIEIGRFMVEGLSSTAPSGSPVVFELELTLDGILDVSVREQRTGLQKAVRIEDAFRRTMTAEERAAASARLIEVMGPDSIVEEPGRAAVKRPAELPMPDGLDEAQRQLWTHAAAALRRASEARRALRGAARDEVDEFRDLLQGAMSDHDWSRVSDHANELDDVLFYL